MYWYEPTYLTFRAFMSSVWIDAVVIGSLPYRATAIPTRERILFISQLHLGWTTDGADGSTFCLVMFSESVVHLCLLDRVRIPGYRS